MRSWYSRQISDGASASPVTKPTFVYIEEMPCNRIRDVDDGGAAQITYQHRAQFHVFDGMR